MFISLEGPEGSGKTTQTVKLAGFLRQKGYPVFATREPGGTPIGDKIRAVLFDLNHAAMRPRTETLLLQASRSQLVERIIRPHLEKGDVVLCDRYADSTLAYQGYGHRIDLEQLRVLIDFATGGLRPDLTLLLDVDVEEGLRRRSVDGVWNRLDAYDMDFHQRVRQGYHLLAQAESQRWVVIDAGHPPDQVQADIRQAVIEKLGVKREA